MSCFVYVLKLIKNKYYIGKSMEPFTRINNHFKGLGSKWTKKYKPVEVMKVINECDQFDEDKYTKMYMAKYGIDNVRGGSYCGLFIDANTRKYINKEIATAFDKCFICGGYYHMANMCPDKYTSFSASTPDTNSKYEPDLDPIIELPIEEEYYKRCEEFEEAIKGNDFDISTLTNGQLYMIDTEGNISIKPKDIPVTGEISASTDEDDNTPIIKSQVKKQIRRRAGKHSNAIKEKRREHQLNNRINNIMENVKICSDNLLNNNSQNKRKNKKCNRAKKKMNKNKKIILSDVSSEEN